MHIVWWMKPDFTAEETEEEGLLRDLPGSPVVETRRSHCRGTRFDPWGELRQLTAAAEHDQNRKGGADHRTLNPVFWCQVHCSCTHSLLPGLQLWHVHTMLPSAGKVKTSVRVGTARHRVNQQLPEDHPEGYIQKSGHYRVTCSLAVQPYTHIFSKMEIISFWWLLKWFICKDSYTKIHCGKVKYTCNTSQKKSLSIVYVYSSRHFSMQKYSYRLSYSKTRS